MRACYPICILWTKPRILSMTKAGSLMTLTCMKQRDGARKFEPIPLARQVIDLGEVDDMGEKVTSCVVVAGTAKITATAISKKLQQALEALQIEGATTATQWARTLET